MTEKNESSYPREEQDPDLAAKVAAADDYLLEANSGFSNEVEYPLNVNHENASPDHGGTDYGEASSTNSGGND
ncbi:MAG TPA: hypothetical protein VK338_01280 [Candidatus Nitrosocosmicus sp.]|nr:hypothetical protein [Candidatus Nitrosocosmicus sp.]